MEDLTEPVEVVVLSHWWIKEAEAISLDNSNRRQRLQESSLNWFLFQSISDLFSQDTIFLCNPIPERVLMDRLGTYPSVLSPQSAG